MLLSGGKRAMAFEPTRTPMRRQIVRYAVAALILAAPLAACGNNETREIKVLKSEVQDAYGDKNFAHLLDLSQKGFALARKAEGDTAPDTLFFVQAISEAYLGMHNSSSAIRAMKQELALRSNAGQSEKKLQSRRTRLIQIAEDSGDHTTAIDQTVIIAKAIDMGPGKDPQPTYRTETAYPPDQYRQHVEGDVDIAFDLDADGKPVGAHVAKATPPTVFNDAALDSFRKWRFTPLIDNGEPVSSTDHHFTLAFRMSRD
jgi:TonB family protein